jgi:YD repeat-containing protein
MIKLMCFVKSNGRVGMPLSSIQRAALGVNLLALASSAHSAETQKYRYDAKGRLLKVERTGTVNNGVTTEYTHDKADNRTRLKTTGSANPPP